MKMSLKYVIDRFGGILVALLLGACSTTLDVTSTPSGADVWVKPLGSGGEKKLGQTPITLNPSDLEGVPSGSGPVKFRISKDGYKPLDVLVTDIGASSLSVSVDLEAGIGFDNPSRLNFHMEKIFSAQQLINLRRLDEAQELLEGVREAVPTLAVTHELLGGVYFLKGNRAMAQDSLRRALALNPNSIDALQMQDSVSRMPASEEAEQQERAEDETP